MKYLKQWFKQAKTHRYARQWLTHIDNDKLAAHCLFYLNRIARRSSNQARKHFIYTCKNHLLRLFYERGYCVDLTQQRQGLRCWHTRDYNEGYEDYCEKCDNTGWYRLHNLYRFVFVVGGHRYVWHQPESLVTWPVTLTEAEVSEYKEYISEPTGFTTVLGDLYRAVLYQHLLSQGVPRSDLPPVLTLRGALRDEWYWNVQYRFSPRRNWSELRYWAKRKWERFAVWLERQAKLKPGDKARVPVEPFRLVRVKAIKFRYDWPSYEDMYIASVEYLDELITCFDGSKRPATGTWKVDQLTPVSWRVEVAKKLLTVVNKVRSDEDEIPF
jgi:hypothetical protein